MTAAIDWKTLLGLFLAISAVCILGRIASLLEGIAGILKDFEPTLLDISGAIDETRKASIMLVDK